MAHVTIRSVKKRYGDIEVMHGVDIDIADGSFTVLVGPSGCGKSTLLRMIAGLEQVSEGEIQIGGKRVNDVLPKYRDIAMVFQNYALYPHKTVRENMSFSLMLSKVAQWALMNLRSLPIGMRIDQWIAADYPELRELQHRGIAMQQQQSMDVLAFRVGKLTVPTTLLGTLAAYALFADRLMGSEAFAIPFQASGLLGHGEELMSIWDASPHRPDQDCALVGQWAAASGLSEWYSWVPYQP